VGGGHDLLAITLLACVLSISGVCRAAGGPEQSPAPAGSAASGPAIVKDAGYVLGPGDKIRVITFGEEALTGEFFVGSQGQVSMPLIGDLKAGGLTIAQFTDEVTRALADGFLKDPRVSVEVLDFRPFYILGEVNRPGQYPYSQGLTVMDAVATAGGFTYRANTRTVFIKAGAGAVERKAPLASTTLVEPGDTIRIGERFF
jgi:polysaccharide export outer membrane protein